MKKTHGFGRCEAMRRGGRVIGARQWLVQNLRAAQEIQGKGPKDFALGSIFALEALDF
jgi:hypothetical protein